MTSQRSFTADSATRETDPVVHFVSREGISPKFTPPKAKNGGFCAS
jgi:hypothetical protein